MIIDALMFISNVIFAGIMEFFPVADLNIVTFIESNMSQFKGFLNSVNWFFPVDTLFTILGFVITIELLSLVLKLVFWVTENLSIGLFKAPK